MAGDKLRELKEKQRELDSEADNYDKRSNSELTKKFKMQENKIYGDPDLRGTIADNYDAAAAGREASK